MDPKKGKTWAKTLVSDFERALEQRDAEQLLASRDAGKADRVTRPITRFARAHMSHNLALLARWPELTDATERVQAVREWYEELSPRIDRHLDEWFAADSSNNIRGEFIAAGFREAVANMLACDAGRDTPRAMLWRERFNARALEIAEVLTTKVDQSLAIEPLKRAVIVIIVWGEHGAHFPDT